MRFPPLRLPPLNVITPFHPEAMGPSLTGCASTSRLTSTGSAVWTGANIVTYYPFRLFMPATAVKMSYLVGGTAAGNVDLAIYDSAKTRIINTGSTAQGSINTLQEFDITDTPLSPGSYFMAITGSDATGTAFNVALVDEILQAAFPIYDETTGGFGCPATAAFAPSTIASPKIFAMGVHFNTLI